MTLDDVAGRLGAASDAISDASNAFEAIGVVARDFGADAGGQLGELGRQLYALWSAAVLARTREATAHAGRLSAAASAARAAARGYQEADVTFDASRPACGGSGCSGSGGGGRTDG
ncbi:MAG: hypothetical protein JXA67_15170 [Micromonosporaceae bacterium]|nr:hypothetical protein [Micromonosporaceae bacterium]